MVEDLLRIGKRVDDQAGKNHRSDRMKPKLKGGHNPEIPSPTTEPPEKIGVFLFTCLDELPISSDDIS